MLIFIEPVLFVDYLENIKTMLAKSMIALFQINGKVGFILAKIAKHRIIHITTEINIFLKKFKILQLHSFLLKSKLLIKFLEFDSIPNSFNSFIFN